MNKLSNFGYTKVTSKEKTKLVQKVFSEVASNYDLMNDVMSFGTHRMWKRKFVDLINPIKGDKIIDVGSGSGDISKEIFNRNRDVKIDMIDLNAEMLSLGRQKIKNNNINFYLANAEELNFKNNIYDKYLISFCLRNITNTEKSLSEAFRILKPGGKFFCLEFSRPESSIISKLYDKYKSIFLPLSGSIFANNKDAYKYLSESIDLFLDQKNLKNKLIHVGFTNVTYFNLFNGIVSVHTGYKV